MNELDVVAGGGVDCLMAAYLTQLAGARVLLLGSPGCASTRISSLNTALDQDSEGTPSRLFDTMFRAGGYINNSAVVAVFIHRIKPETKHLDQLDLPLHHLDGQLGRRQTAGLSRTGTVCSDGMIGVDPARRVSAEIQVRTASPCIHIKGDGSHKDTICRAMVQEITAGRGCRRLRPRNSITDQQPSQPVEPTTVTAAIAHQIFSTEGDRP